MVENETVEKIEEVVAEEIIEEAPVVEPEPEPVFCVVTNCARLNIRENPDASAPVVCVASAGDELMISPDTSTDEWYNVYTKAGVEGFCMKKFTALKA